MAESIKVYYGTKCITAYPEIKDGILGYAVIYRDGYKSWSPKDVFEEAYVSVNNMSFGHAHQALLDGHSVARCSWDSEDKPVYLLWLDRAHRDGWSLNYCIKITTNDIDTAVWKPNFQDLVANDWYIYTPPS